MIGRFIKSFNRNFIIYSMIGVMGVTIDFLIFALMVDVLNIDYLVSNIISTSLGIINNFFFNAFFNFQKRDKLLHRFISFYLIGILGIILSSIILFVGVDTFDLNEKLVKLFSIIIVVIVQYSLNKRISFRNI